MRKAYVRIAVVVFTYHTDAGANTCENRTELNVYNTATTRTPLQEGDREYWIILQHEAMI